MKSVIFLFLFTFLSGCFAEDSSIPGGIISEAWHLITNGTVLHFVGCDKLEEFNESVIQYYLYTRENRHPIILTQENLCKLDSSKDTKILFTGWLDSVFETFMLDMVHAYLDRYDCNVIAVQYLDISNTEYTQAYCNMITAAQIIGNFLCNLYEEDYLDFDRVHMVAHSLGAHLAGLLGQSVQNMCNQTVDRITGLDPAGPIYQNQANSARLDKSDARFVDVIHTNMGIAGYYGSMGHVDFFPNCGIIQPGCINITSFPDVISIISNFVECSHTRSAIYFTESINATGPKFNSRSCSLCPNSKSIGNCIIGDTLIFEPYHAVMGEDCPRDLPANKFILRTNSKSPFARG